MIRTITLMILAALTAVPAFAHEVQPPPMKESCDAAKWLGNSLAGTDLADPEYRRLDALASKAFDECERYQAQDSVLFKDYGIHIKSYGRPTAADHWAARPVDASAITISPPCRYTKPGVIQCD